MTLSGTAEISAGLAVDTDILFVDSAANMVGIGTDSPTSPLHITAEHGQAVKIHNSIPTLFLSDSDVVDQQWQIRNDNGDFKIQRQDDDGNGAQSKVTLKPDGRAGIGTTTPDALFHVWDTSASFSSEVKLARFSYFGGRSLQILGPATDNINDFFTMNTQNAFNVRIDSTDVLTIASNCKVGIGTTIPVELFEVKGGKSKLEQESWIAPALINSWANYGSGYNPAGYFKDSQGIVHLRGLVKSGTGTIFTLPAGYRPAYRMLYGVDGANAHARVDIDTSGNVIHAGGSNVHLSLDVITFRAEQ